MEELKCLKCGKNMEKTERKIAIGPGGGENGSKYPSEEVHIKYRCINPKCCNYNVEFYEEELKENHP